MPMHTHRLLHCDYGEARHRSGHIALANIALGNKALHNGFKKVADRPMIVRHARSAATITKALQLNKLKAQLSHGILTLL